MKKNKIYGQHILRIHFIIQAVLKVAHNIYVRRIYVEQQSHNLFIYFYF
jgi:hypothetical protein